MMDYILKKFVNDKIKGYKVLNLDAEEIGIIDIANYASEIINGRITKYYRKAVIAPELDYFKNLEKLISIGINLLKLGEDFHYIGGSLITLDIDDIKTALRKNNLISILEL